VIATLDAAGVPCGPINRIDEVFAEPQIEHMKLRREVTHPTIGQLTLTGFPYSFSDAELEIRQAPPLLGQHTEEILFEAGYSAEEIAEMLQSGAVTS
jgi:crotonobetainyl-CoA:carnitine CoA-transferase CaiB-like acyl-CoA transferase